MDVDASRVVFIPHVGRHLLTATFAGLAIPILAGGLPALLLTGLVWVFWSFSAAWQTALVLAGLLLVVGLAIAVSMVHGELAEICWIDLQPAGEPTLVVFRKVLSNDSVAVADLRSVNIVETFALGRSTGCKVSLTTADGRHFRCPKIVSYPPMVPAAKLGEWFTDRLGSAGVEVTNETVVERAHLPIESWYTRSQVAALWGVPVEEVDGLLGLLKVPRERFTPRIGAMHGVNRTRWLFNPDDVHTAAAQVPAARAAAAHLPSEETKHRD